MPADITEQSSQSNPTDAPLKGEGAVRLIPRRLVRHILAARRPRPRPVGPLGGESC